MIDPEDTKKRSEEIILANNGRICDWLPTIEFHTNLKTREEIINRALILNALINIAFKAPTSVIKEWIENNNLSEHLTNKEKSLLSNKNEELTEKETSDLFWNLESLWTLIWVGGLIDKLPFDKPVGDNLASLSPNLQLNEDGSKYRENMKIRSIEEIYGQLDLYLRLHWFTQDSILNKQTTGKFSNDVIFERRKALEWVYNNEYNWDDIPLNT